MSEYTVIHEGTFRVDQTSEYIHLPFDVPMNATRIQVEYEYSEPISAAQGVTGGNTIDLGVFDSRGIEFLNAGFRGWSGSERSSCFIAMHEATPGYLAGPLIPGVWHVLLGLYKIGPAGCSYRVAVTISSTKDATPRAQISLVPTGDLPSSSPRAPFAPWLRGELHCHTVHSDGDLTPRELVELAKTRSLDFLAIADHNTIASQRELAMLRDPGLVLIRGVEVTSFYGHFCCWGIPDWVDFRVTSPQQMVAALEFANSDGAVTSANHPKPLGPMWDFATVANYQCIEVWNGSWQVRNQDSLDFWVRQLATGRRIPAVGGSDFHRQQQMLEHPPRAPGMPTVWVYVPGPPSPSAILAAIRQGHMVLSDTPDGPLLDLRGQNAIVGDEVVRPTMSVLALRVRCQRGNGNVLRLLDQNGLLFEQLVTADEQEFALDLPVPSSHYVRAELRAPDQQMRALTNPLYLA